MLTPALKQSVLKKHPCFSSLTSEEIISLAELLTEKHIPTGGFIVKEDDVIDSVYFIVKGIVEVQHIVKQNNQKTVYPVVALNEGEAIGLGETGFYSATEARTATVIAVTDCLLLRLDLAAFYIFTTAHPDVNKVMHDNVDLMLRMSLIKHTAPFAKLSMETIRWLANEISQVFMPTGKIIFNQGDRGEYCYLIRTGRVEIFLTDEKGEETRLAILKPPMVFGETALLMDLPRNASARVLKDSEIFLLKRETLFSVIKQENKAITSLMSLIKKRTRPKSLPSIEMCVHYASDQSHLITLKDGKNGNYYRLSEEGFFIWQLLNGIHTLRDIALAFYDKYGIFDPAMISNFIAELQQEGFVEQSILSNNTAVIEKPWLRIWMRIRHIMEASVSFGNVDNWLTNSYQRFVRVFFTIPVQIGFALLALIGLVTFFMSFNYHVELLAKTRYSGLLIIATFPIALASVFLHELAHAYTTKAFGYQVKVFGIGWYWFGPVAFTDTSDMWLSSKWPRIMVDVAGMYMDSLIAAFAILVATVWVQNDVWALFFWLVALFNYLAIFANLSPIVELDGYYMINDLMNKVNLQEDAVSWLVDKLPKSWYHLSFYWQYRAECLYWIVCVVYLMLEFVLSYLIATILLRDFFGFHNPYFTVLPAFGVLILSTYHLFGNIQRYHKRPV